MIRKKKKSTSIYQAAVNVFAFVRDNPSKPQTKRVNTILELLVAQRKEKDFAERAELLRQLREAFMRYQWRREILFTTEGPHEVISAARQQTADDEWEYGAVHILLVVAERHPDYVSKIRRCDVCERWMIAAKANHRFCEGKCRQYHFESDPKTREKKLANMRDNYASLKARNKQIDEKAGYTKTAKKSRKRA